MMSSASLATFGIDDAGGTILWTEPGQGVNGTDVMRVPLQGGSPTVVGSIAPPFSGLGTEPDGLAYAWSPYGSGLAMITPQNAMSMTAIQCPTNTEKIVFDGGALYTASEYGVFQLHDATPVRLSEIRAFGLAVDATTVYFTDHCKAGMGCTLPSLLPYPTGQVWSVPRAGGTSMSLAHANGLLGGIAVDAAHIYFANRQDGTITRMNKDGSDSSVVGTSAAGEQAIDVAVDDQCVYWSAASGDSSPSTIYAAPK